MDELLMTRLGVRIGEPRMTEFRDRLQALFDELAAAPDDPSAQPWSLFLAMHPDVSRG